MQAVADLGNERYLIHSLGWHGRLEHGQLSDTVLDASSRFYLRRSEHRLLFASAMASLISHPDPEKGLLLGGDNGLRGYSVRYQAGATHALLPTRAAVLRLLSATETVQCRRRGVLRRRPRERR